MKESRDLFSVMLAFMVAMSVVIGIIAISCGLLDWSDRRECRASGGSVEYLDHDNHDEWRCVKPSAERVP